MTELDENCDDVTPFIVFSDDWGVHPSSCQHVFHHISKTHTVAWVNTVGMRRPRFQMSDFKKGLRKLFNMFSSLAFTNTVSVENDVRVYHPMMIPFNDIQLVRRINRRLVQRTLRRVTKDLYNREPVIVATVPNACDYIDLVERKRTVYYCVDDFSEWPGLDRGLVMEMEANLIEKVDLFIATSPALFDRLAQYGKPTSLLPHGVDVELFASDVNDEHPVLDGIPMPRAGYFGLFDDRSDQELIATVAEGLPDVSFVIVGPVETDVSRLDSVDNVYFAGSVRHHELPAVVKGLHILFAAYVVNALSDALSPLKFKEYLSTGRPILSTPIAAVSEFGGNIRIATTVNEWRAEIRALLSQNADIDRTEVIAALSGESWSEKSKQFLRICFVSQTDRTDKSSVVQCAPTE